MKRFCFLLAMISLSSVLSASEYDISTIYQGTTSSPYDRPRINNNRQVVFAANSHRVMLYDDETKNAELVYSSHRNNSQGYCPQINNNSEIVWAYGTSLYHYDPNYDGNSSTFTPDKVLGSHPISSQSDAFPAEINDNGDIVWRRNSGNIMYCDVSENSVQSIYSNVRHNNIGVSPQINNNGDVVWRENWTYSRISYYDADYSGGGYTPDSILRNYSSNPRSMGYGPTTYINDNGDVLFASNQTLLFYDGSSMSNPVPLASIVGQQVRFYGNVDLNNNGDAVWYDSTTHQVMYFNSDLQTVINVSGDTLLGNMAYNPILNDNGDVVWGTNNQLYLYNKALDEIILLGNYLSYSYFATYDLNDNGDVVWMYQNKIFLAAFNEDLTVPEPLSIVLFFLGFLGIFVKNHKKP